jgi:hypothetical protein
MVPLEYEPHVTGHPGRTKTTFPNHGDAVSLKRHCEGSDLQRRRKGPRDIFRHLTNRRVLSQRHAGGISQVQICVPILWLCWSRWCCTAVGGILPLLPPMIIRHLLMRYLQVYRDHLRRGLPNVLGAG